MLRKAAFTLVELLIVVAVIAILLGFLVPIMWSLVSEAGKTADISQVKLMQSATDQYDEQFGFAPGYFDESYLCSDSVYTDFTSTENFIVSMLGGNTSNNETDWTNLDVSAIGRGAYSNGGYLGAFYNPREGELKAVNQTLGNDNEFPEICTLSTAVPILYWRVRAEEHSWDKRMPVAWDDKIKSNKKGSIYRITNEDFLGASQLNGQYDQRNESIISNHVVHASDGRTSTDYKYSEWYGANSNLAWILNYKDTEFRTWGRYSNTSKHWPASNSMNMYMEDRYGGSKGSIAGGYLLLSAGADGIYLSREQTQQVNEEHVAWHLAQNQGSNWDGTVFFYDIFDVYNGIKPNHLFLMPINYQADKEDRFLNEKGNNTRVEFKNKSQYEYIEWENLEKYDDVFVTGGTVPANQ